MVNDRHLWNPGFISYGMIPHCRRNATVFSHRRIYSLWLAQGLLLKLTNFIFGFFAENEMNPARKAN
jgi:hypothetical protein